MLTLEEAKAHLRVPNIEDVYEKEFIDHVFNKHALARKKFRQLSTYDQHFTEFAKSDPKLDENSDYYHRPNKHECDIEVFSDHGGISSKKKAHASTSVKITDENAETEDEFIKKRIYEDSDNYDEDNESNE